MKGSDTRHLQALQVKTGTPPYRQTRAAPPHTRQGSSALTRALPSNASGPLGLNSFPGETGNTVRFTTAVGGTPPHTSRASNIPAEGTVSPTPHSASWPRQVRWDALVRRRAGGQQQRSTLMIHLVPQLGDFSSGHLSTSSSPVKWEASCPPPPIPCHWQLLRGASRKCTGHSQGLLGAHASGSPPPCLGTGQRGHAQASILRAPQSWSSPKLPQPANLKRTKIHTRAVAPRAPWPSGPTGSCAAAEQTASRGSPTVTRPGSTELGQSPV